MTRIFSLITETDATTVTGRLEIKIHIMQNESKGQTEGREQKQPTDKLNKCQDG